MLYIIRQILQPVIAALTALIMMFSPAGSQKAPEEYDQVKNVIYLIGDGMGPLHLEKAKQERNISLVMDTFEYEGRSHTRSQFNSVTDSAAEITGPGPVGQLAGEAAAPEEAQEEASRG